MVESIMYIGFSVGLVGRVDPYLRDINVVSGIMVMVFERSEFKIFLDFV